MPTRSDFWESRVALAVMLLFFAIPFSQAAESKRPSIVLIMADDLGFSDLGCYGGEIETPHLDRIAQSGLRYTQFYNTSRCCPSRAALMTGKYQHSVDIGWMTSVDEHRPGYRGQLSFDHPTLAELLRDAGYQTRMAGKWHLTLDTNFLALDTIPNGSWPTQRGFDEYYGGLSGGGSYWRPKSLARNLTRISPETLPEDYYYTDAITEYATKFIRESNLNKPLFLYVGYYAPHRPLEAPADRIERCRERYKVGYDELRRQRFARQKKLGFFSDDAALGSPGKKLPDDAPAWEQLDKKQQKNWIELKATYAAMVEIMDDGVGEIVTTLSEQGRLDDTLFLFLSDNGSTREGGLMHRLGADLSNTPYRSYKQFTHFGGIASPLIVNWPERISSGGALCREVSHINDIVPSCIEAIGSEYPNKFNDKNLSPPDGTSLIGTFAGEKLSSRALFWEHQTSRAVQRERWRLVSIHKSSPWELYDLKADPFEQHNLANDYPEKVAELSDAWSAWAKTNNVFPLETRTWNARINHYSK